MKRTTILFSVAFVTVLVLFQVTLGQNKEVTYADVFKMEQSAMMLLRSLPHRVSMTSWVFPERGKEALHKSTLIREIISADRSRWIQENDNPGSFRRMEVVTIGDKNYRKIDDGPWQILPPPTDNGVPSETPVRSGAKPRFENIARLIETRTDGNGSVSVYETTSKSTREEGGKEISKINTSRYWFRYDGRLLRKEMENETVGVPRILKNSAVYEYEGIMIEAPIK